MVAMRMFLGALAAVALVSCASPAPQPPAWVYAPGGYFDADDFHNGQYGADRVIIAPAPSSTDARSGIAVLDGPTGQVVWSRSDFKWFFWADARSGPFYALGTQEGPTLSRGPFEHVVALDPATGTELRRVKLESPRDRYANFYFDAGRLFFLDGYGKNQRFGQIDPVTGATLVEFDAPGANALFAPVFLADRVVFQDERYIAYSLRDGRELFRIDGQCCSLLASSKWLYVRSGIDSVGVYTHDGEKAVAYKGQLESVSGERVVVRVDVSETPERDAIEVYTPPKTEPEWRTEAEGYFGAVALFGDRLFFFASRSDELVEVDLARGTRRTVVQVGGHLVISPDATGFSGPHLSAAPIYSAPWLYVEDFNNVAAYRIDR
jgi:hypothetical protein